MHNIDFLSIPLFKTLDRLDIARLVPNFQQISLETDEVLFRQGDKGDALYIIVIGRVSIRKQLDGEEHEVAVLSVGDCFGEMALLSGAPRSATVIALEPLTVLKLSQTRFNILLKKHPTLGSHLANLLAKRFAAPQPVSDIPTPERHTSPVAAAGGRFSDVTASRNKKLAVVCGTAAVATAVNLWLPGHGVNNAQATLNALLLAATILWAIDIFSYHAVAVALPVVIVMLGIARPERALSGFSSPSWFLVLGIFAITAAVAKTGLLYRLVLMLTRWFPTSYNGQTFAVALSGLILTPIIPSSNGRMVLAGPIIKGLCETQKFRKGSPGAVGMAMAGLVGFGHMSYLFMNGTATCLLALGLLPADSIHDISWGSWFMAALPLGLTYFLGCYLAIILIYQPNKRRKIQQSVVQSQLLTLGIFTRDEKLSLFTVLFTLAAFIAQPLHGINSAWIAMSSFLILFGSNVLDERSLRCDIDWISLISFGALVGFGTVISESGLTTLAAGCIRPYLSPVAGNPFLFLPLLAVAVTVVRFALPLPAALLISILAVVPVASTMGINPFVIALVALIACNPWFLPYQNSIYLDLMQSTDGKLFSHSSSRILSYWQVVIMIAAIIVAIPFWRMRGLIN
ncbi:MAG: SLC13 family permease [Desulfuromonadales bacterium]